jgi:hypothetical protein
MQRSHLDIGLTRIRALLAVGIALASSAVTAVASPALKPAKTSAPAATHGSTRNKGSYARTKRAALKRRNVLRNRLAHRG